MRWSGLEGEERRERGVFERVLAQNHSLPEGYGTGKLVGVLEG
jgi:hypothetical protein